MMREILEAADAYGTVEEDELPQMEIGRTYEKKNYAFDIFNDTYKYRPFEMTYGPVYPVSLSVDETIWREARDAFLSYSQAGEGVHSNSNITLENSNELAACFRIIVTSRKVGYILNRLAQAKQ